jgi:acetyl esterase/lipase
MKLFSLTRTVALLMMIIGCASACRQGSQKRAENGTVTVPEKVARASRGGKSAFQTTGTEKNIDMSRFPVSSLNLHYVADDKISHLMDIIYPFRGSPPYKAIVVFHAGGWAAGDKQSESVSPAFQATAQGYAIISVNYRLSDEASWPMPLHDAKAAIRFIRANARKFRLDPEKIVVWGISAGGHIAQMLAATNGQPEFEDPSLGNPGVSSAVQGVVSWNGISDLTTLGDEGLNAASRLMGFDVITEKAKASTASPVEHVTGEFPPILLVHGTADQVVPYSQALSMLEKVNKITPAERASLITIEGAAHNDIKMNTSETISKIIDFVDNILHDGKNPYRSATFMNVKIHN